MKEIKYTLVCDGPTDKALLPILTWLLRQHLPEHAIQPNWLDIRELNAPPRSLHEKIRKGLELYPCDLMFVHRDAERENVEARTEEINNSLAQLPEYGSIPFALVIPVRMTEAWLLFDQQAIREAAGNPNGNQPLASIELRRVEDLPDPKDVLKVQLRTACGLHGRRLKQFNESRAMARVAALVSDFAVLRNLSAFQHLEEQVISKIAGMKL